MKKDNKTIKVAAIASGAALLTAFGTTPANAAQLLDFESLGTGSQLRSNLLTADALNSFTSNTDVEFECGEGKCGEGKCGEDGAKKTDKKNEMKKSDAAAKPARPAKSDKTEAAPMPEKADDAAKPAKVDAAPKKDAPK